MSFRKTHGNLLRRENRESSIGHGRERSAIRHRRLAAEEQVLPSTNAWNHLGTKQRACQILLEAVRSRMFPSGSGSLRSGLGCDARSARTQIRVSDTDVAERKTGTSYNVHLRCPKSSLAKLPNARQGRAQGPFRTRNQCIGARHLDIHSAVRLRRFSARPGNCLPGPTHVEQLDGVVGGTILPP